MKLNVEPSAKDLRNLVEIGLAMGVAKKKGEDDFMPIKLAYHPYVTNRQAYTHLQAVSQVWQKLIFKASRNGQLIERVYSGIKGSDAMISRLMQIRSLKNNTHEDGLVLARCDYFVSEEGQPKIIEYNLTSVSMTAHTENFQQAKKLSDPANSHKYVDNRPNKHFASQIHALFARRQLKGSLLMIVSPNEYNIIEQRLLEIQLLKLGVQVTRLTFFEAVEQLTIDTNGDLKLHDENIAVVYYRAGYQLSDYQQDPEAAWKARELIELSNAIKIPNITFDLMNQKRMQAELSKESVYSQYLSTEEAALLKSTLVPIWDFDSMGEEEFAQLLKHVDQSGKAYILKPNLEGGGHNIHGEEVKQRLKEMDRAQRMKYILMEKIITKPIQNILLYGITQTIKGKCIYEVSQYGVIAIENSQLLQSESCGFLIRVKPEAANEGGILAGIGSICSWMIEDSE